MKILLITISIGVAILAGWYWISILMRMSPIFPLMGAYLAVTLLAIAMGWLIRTPDC